MPVTCILNPCLVLFTTSGSVQCVPHIGAFVAMNLLIVQRLSFFSFESTIQWEVLHADFRERHVSKGQGHDPEYDNYNDCVEGREVAGCGSIVELASFRG